MAEKKGYKNQEIASTIANSDEFLTNLIYCSEYDLYYLWNGHYYKELSGYDLKKTIHLFMAKLFPSQNINDGLLTDIIKSLRYYNNLVKDLPDFSRIAFKDKNYNLETFQWEPHSHDNLTIFNVPYNSEDVNMPTPVWDNFLATSLVFKGTTDTDTELVDFVQEMFGYFLLPSLKGSSAFFLVGGGSNGKSVMVKVLEQMFGREYCSSMSIQHLTTEKFATAHLVGKKINISNEEESKFMRADTFKALITGDTINAQKKFGDPFEFTPNTKFIFATNEMPTFDTMNYGLKRRMKFIPFFRRFKDEDQDKDLQDKLSKEIPGIIGWAIEGAKKFVANDRVFKQAASSVKHLNEFIEEISSALTFFNEYYIVDDYCKTTNEEIYNHYDTWCDDNGRSPLNSQNFWKELSKEYGDQFKILNLRVNDINGVSRPVKGKNIGRKPDITEPEITIEDLPL